MFVIRQYSTQTDELSALLRLSGVHDSELADVLGTEPNRNVSTPLSSERLRALADRFGFSVPADRDVAYFLDFDAEPAAKSWERPAGAVSAS